MTWDAAARENAMGYILTGVHWLAEDFYLNGREEIARVLARLDERGIPHGTQTALDFGCGIGRLSVALADHYETVVGADASGEMLSQAKHHERVAYLHVPEDNLGDLRNFPPSCFDFIYTSLVLQHMPQGRAARWIADLFTLLKPTGTFCFQIPDGPDHMVPQSPFLSMWGTKRADIHKLVADAGAQIVDEYKISEHDTWDPWLYTARFV